MDSTVLLWLNHRLATSQDGFYLALMLSDRIPWILMAMLLCWMWFAGASCLLPKRPGGILNLHARHIAIMSIVSLPLLFICSQLLQQAFARDRPLYIADLLHIPIPPQQWQLVVDGFSQASAFPSDHAVIMGLLFMGVWHLSRLLATFTGLCIIGFLTLRIALGFHWPSDTIAGLLLGGLAGWIIVISMPYQLFLTQRLRTHVYHYPALTHTLLFLFLFDFSQKFTWIFILGKRIRQLI